METAGLKGTLKQVRDALAVLYSLLVMATIIPGIGSSSAASAIVIPYYVFVPGYFVTILLRNKVTGVEGLFYSIVWSLVTLGSVYSITTLSGFQAIQINILVPLFTVVVLGYDRFRR